MRMYSYVDKGKGEKEWYNLSVVLRLCRLENGR